MFWRSLLQPGAHLLDSNAAPGFVEPSSNDHIAAKCIA